MTRSLTAEDSVIIDQPTLDKSMSCRDAARRYRAYLTRRRHELLATMRAVVEFAEILQAEPEFSGNPRMAGDLATIRDSAIRLQEMIETALSPALVATEAAATVLNHNLRNVLTILIIYGSELQTACSKPELHHLVTEVAEICSLSRRALALVDSTVTQLRDSDDFLHTEDVRSYLDRAAWTPDDRSEGADEALSAEPGSILVADDSQPIRGHCSGLLLRQQGPSRSPPPLMALGGDQFAEHPDVRPHPDRPRDARRQRLRGH